MNVKKIGFIIVITGLIITLFAGFNYLKNKKVMGKTGIQITQGKGQAVNGFPFIGIGVVMIGGILYLSGKMKEHKKNSN